MEHDERRIRQIWNNDEITVLLRRAQTGEKLRLRVRGNKEGTFPDRQWIRKGRRSKPKWDRSERYWEAPKAWFNDLVFRSLKDFGRVYIVQPYREQEICAPACQNAQGQICQCSCMGQNHGMQNMDSSWFVVDDTFATRWGDKKLACRLLKAE